MSRLAYSATDAHLYFKRAKSSELFGGDGDFHRERVATRLGL